MDAAPTKDARWFIENAINAKGDLIRPEIAAEEVIAAVRCGDCSDQPST